MAWWGRGKWNHTACCLFTTLTADVENVEMKKCEREKCGKEFEPQKYWQKFCSKKCGWAERSERYWVKRLSAKSAVGVLFILVAMSGCAFTPYSLHIEKPVTIVVENPDVVNAHCYKPGNLNDDGTPQTKPPKCCFDPETRTIWINAYSGLGCIAHELAHASGMSPKEADKYH